ncbi:MAG: hypothetical protein IKC59_04400 [Clostridia bacterium]|nr:hypothetical protein [Clostridia bacterium]
MKGNLKKRAFRLTVCSLWMAMLCVLGVFAETEYNDGQVYANPLPLNELEFGKLSASDDVDYYSFEIPYDGVIVLSFSTPVQSDSGDSWNVSIEADNNSNKKLMTKNVSGGTTRVSFPTLGLKKGLYYVVVKAGQASKWNENEYSLSLSYTQSNGWEREYNDDRGTAWEMVYDAEYQGVTMSSSDEDWYKIQYVSKDLAELCFSHPTGSSSAFGWRLEIIDGQNETVHRENVAQNSLETRLLLSDLNLEDGAYYYVRISSGSSYSDGVYSLSLVKPHQCDKIFVEAKPSTCKEAGHDAHYRCKSESCGKYYDENGKELQNVMRPLAEHAWGDWKVVSIATCTSAEVRKRICAVCEKEELEALGEAKHLFNSQSKVERIEPTCTQKGVLRTYCAAAGCEVYRSEELTEKGHDYSLTWTVEVAATCTQTGWESRRCSRCESKIDGRSIPVTAHPFGTWRTVTAPTCSLMGREQRDCRSCNAYETRDVDALGHDYRSEFWVDDFATCTQVGSKSRHCSRCDAKTEVTVIPKTDHVYSEYDHNKDGHWLVCTCGKKGSIELHGLSYTVKKNPTCMQNGVGSRHCAICGGRWDVVIPYSEAYHDYSDWHLTAEPSCTKEGEQQRSCNLCGVTQIQTLSKTPHRYQEAWTQDQAPSCARDGSRSRHCEDCNARTDEEVISATGHTFGAWAVTVHPTCEEKGSECRVCQDCLEVQTRELDAKGHDFSTAFTTDKEATCDEKGERSRHCSRCSMRTDIAELPELGHRFGEWEFATSATCIAHGTEIRRCSVCPETETRETNDPRGHVFGDWSFATDPTCTESGTEKRICSVCSHVEIRETAKAIGHAFGNWCLATVATCVEGGTEKRICSVCSHTETRGTSEALGHVFGEWTSAAVPTCTKQGTETRMCSVCFHPETRAIEALGHDFEKDFTVDTKASCESAGEKSRHCVRCDAKSDPIVIPALEHLYGEWSTVQQPTCTVGELEKRTCDRCLREQTRERTPALGHSFASEFDVDVISTCTVDGSQSRHCSRCDERTDVTVIPATGHIYGEGIVTAVSTAEAFGIKQFSCIRCEHVCTETMPKLPPMMLNSEEIIWKGGSKRAPIFRSAAALADFVEVRVNGAVIDSDCYILREGSTVVELTPAYLKGLRGGAYSLEIVSTTGIAVAEFTVKNGVPFLWLWILVGALLLSVVAVTLWFFSKKKPIKQSKKKSPAPNPSESAEQIPLGDGEHASDVPTTEISGE